MTWSELIFCEPKYARHVHANWLALFVKAIVYCVIGGVVLARRSSDDLAVRLLIVLTSPHRYRSPVDRVTGLGSRPREAGYRGGCGTRRCSRLYGDCMSALWTASGREAATRMAERFHNFRVSA